MLVLYMCAYFTIFSIYWSDTSLDLQIFYMLNGEGKFWNTRRLFDVVNISALLL